LVELPGHHRAHLLEGWLLLTSLRVDIEVMECHARASEVSPEWGERAAGTPALERKKRVRIRDQIQQKLSSGKCTISTPY
jgi:hypothetical protein